MSRISWGGPLRVIEKGCVPADVTAKNFVTYGGFCTVVAFGVPLAGACTPLAHDCNAALHNIEFHREWSLPSTWCTCRLGV